MAAAPGRPTAPHVLAAIRAVQAKFPEAPRPRPAAPPHAAARPPRVEPRPRPPLTPALAKLPRPAGPPVQASPHPGRPPAVAPSPGAQPGPVVARHVAHAVAQARVSPLPARKASAPPPAPPAVPSARAVPARAVVPARSCSIQPYTEVTMSGKAGKLSANAHYFVAGGQLWVRQTATDPTSCNPTVETIRPKGKGTYVQWEGASLFLKDCLHTAEEIMGKRHFEPGKDIHSQSRDSKESIGVSDAENQRIAAAITAKVAAVNDAADPGAGDAYLIVETGAVKEYPYHAAAVVAVDGTDRVTLEMFAGTQDAKAADRKYPGKFEMYGSGAQSFHSAYAGAFTTPATIVIKPK